MSSQDTCRIVHFKNPDDHARALRHVDQRCSQTGPGRFSGTLCFYPETGGIRVHRVQTNVPLLQEGALSAGERLFSMPLNPRRKTTYQGIAVSDAIGHLTGGESFELQAAGASDHLVISIDDETFSEYAEYLGSMETLDWLARSTLRVRPTALERASAQVMACVEVAEREAEKLRFENARKAFCADVVGNLICLLVEVLPQARRNVTHLTYADVVRRSREHVLAHPEQAISVMDLCRLLRVSRSTLQTSFLEVSGVPPATYLRAMRLSAVRKLLHETPASELGIGAAAARWGFMRGGRFSFDFRNMFGVLPSQVPRP